MIFKDMNLQELIAYKASVEVYGTASELAEVVSRIKELGGVDK